MDRWTLKCGPMMCHVTNLGIYDTNLCLNVCLCKGYISRQGSFIYVAHFKHKGGIRKSVPSVCSIVAKSSFTVFGSDYRFSS